MRRAPVMGQFSTEGFPSGLAGLNQRMRVVGFAVSQPLKAVVAFGERFAPGWIARRVSGGDSRVGVKSSRSKTHACPEMFCAKKARFMECAGPRKNPKWVSKSAGVHFGTPAEPVPGF